MQWIQHEVADESAVQVLARRGKGLHPALARVMVLRGIDSPQKARRFFRDSLSDLPTPLRMRDMEAGVRRLTQAIKRRERVVIYGDFDVDGVTSVVLLITFLRDQGVQAGYFIPNRFKDGYGLGRRGIDFAANDYKADLLIAVDCGITSVADAAYVKEHGMDLIVCDHHLPEAVLPEAVAVIDPNHEACPYPFKGLSACAIAFKLAQTTAQRLGQDPELLNDLLDLVALSTVADMMPLQEENRILVREGLKIVRKSKRPGIQALASLARTSLETIESSDIGWKLGPRINAAGRMREASKAVELLLSEDRDTALEYAYELEGFNKDRRAYADKLVAIARKRAKIQIAGAHGAAVVVHEEGWHRGILGLVAGRLAREFHRPALVLSVDGNKAGGSARSFGDIDLHDALISCQDLLYHFGGHKAAAGLSLSRENIHALRQRLDKYVREHVKPEDLMPKQFYDAEVPLGEIDARFRNIMRHMEPFGKGNPEPLFRASGIRASDLRPMGRGQQHARFSVHASGRSHNVVAFNCGEEIADLADGKPFEMLFSVEQNHYNGVTTDQLRAQHIRFHRG